MERTVWSLSNPLRSESWRASGGSARQGFLNVGDWAQLQLQQLSVDAVGISAGRSSLKLGGYPVHTENRRPVQRAENRRPVQRAKVIDTQALQQILSLRNGDETVSRSGFPRLISSELHLYHMEFDFLVLSRLRLLRHDAVMSKSWVRSNTGRQQIEIITRFT